MRKPLNQLAQLPPRGKQPSVHSCVISRRPFSFALGKGVPLPCGGSKIQKLNTTIPNKLLQNLLCVAVQSKEGGRCCHQVAEV